MTVLTAVLLGLAMGIVFGFLLEKSRVFEPGVILGQFQLRNFLMLRVFLSGVAMGLVVLSALTGFGLAQLAPKATLPLADALGGLLLGAGIALAGACPGTVMAQIGAGYRDAWFTLLGGLLGALAFTYAEPSLAPWIAAAGQGKLTLDAVLGVPFWPLGLAVAALLFLVLLGMERWRPWRAELGEAADGLPPETPSAPPAAPPATRPMPAE
ncbi:YeeE/YedE thiosulfate transporter family protein [Roseomonas sp. E05]|uniref:YeeE/YedE thiosulfate transporter family protein n=1 Tax=Roseomonas sp. E05 TaxID=3046310 RepID=UPI0024B93769|nr:YeeE/YedE thiosulfate transporter family protein [Roseomonas sp. E05]MDJ0389509.1 YeeE/YedE thiosulfate transporter family protein [Roseomonas sp. E05]